MGQPLANVLVVDDLEDDIYITRRYLGAPKGMRCTFVEALDGRAGLTAIAERLSREDAIDLILLDINMPVMDGFEMLQRLRDDAAMAKIPVVMYTGSTYDKDKERARSLGAAGYLEKPAQFSSLSAILETLPSLRLLLPANEPPTLVRA